MITVSMIVWNEFTNDARVLKEAETLAASGYQVTVHALHTPGVTKERDVLPSGVLIRRVARSPLWKLRKPHLGEGGGVQAGKRTQIAKNRKQLTLFRQVLKVAARLWTHFGLLLSMVQARPNIVHAHDVNVLPTAWLASAVLRTPLIYDAHEISTDREGYSVFRNVVAWVEKKLMPRTAGNITTTDARAKFFARAYGISRPVVLQNRPRYSLVNRGNRIREHLKLKNPWPIVLYQGGIQQGRGLPKFVELAADIPNAYFVLIGGGRLAEELRGLRSELKLDDRVFFIPTVSLQELPEFTASADIGVQPIENTCLNHFTTDSNKLFEYVIAGLPIVASRLPEITKVVSQYGLGELVAAGDKQELIRAVAKLLADEELRGQYSRNAGVAAQTLNWEDQEQKLLDLYGQIFS